MHIFCDWLATVYDECARLEKDSGLTLAAKTINTTRIVRRELTSEYVDTGCIQPQDVNLWLYTVLVLFYIFVEIC